VALDDRSKARLPDGLPGSLRLDSPAEAVDGERPGAYPRSVQPKVDLGIVVISYLVARPSVTTDCCAGG
jgi:hypothetical protein